MKMKRIAALLCAAIVGLSTFAGCKDNSKIIMATNAEFAPFEYVYNGEIAGVDVDIATAIAAKLGKKLEILNVDWNSVLVAVPSGKADFAASGMSVKPERLESMDFSDPYYVATQYIIVHETNDTITCAADIKDLIVGTVDGYTGQNVCQDLGFTNIKGYKRGVDAVAELKNGKLDAVVIDSHTAIALIKENPGLKYVDDPAVFESEEYAIPVKKGNTELLNTINSVLAELKAAGKIDEFIALHTTNSGTEE